MCVRPRFEKDSIFRVRLSFRFHPSTTILERDRYFSTPDNCQSRNPKISIVSLGKVWRCNGEEETGLGEKPFESISGRGLEIWEERKGESESSSHRDESGSFSSGKNSGSNRDARLATRTRLDIETDSWARKRERERESCIERSWRNETKIMTKKDFILIYSIRKISRYFEDERVLALLKLDAIYRYERKIVVYSSNISFSNNFYQETGQDADHLYNIFETRHRASTWLDEP